MNYRAGAQPGRPLRPQLALTALTGLVLLAHALLLSGASLDIRPGGLTPPSPAFATRTLPAMDSFAANVAAPVAEARTVASPRPAQHSAPVAATAPIAPNPPAASAERATPLEPAWRQPPATLASPPGPEGRQSPLAAAAVHVPASARVRYKVSAQSRGIPVTGQGELSWRNEGGEYEAQMQVSALFLPTRTQRSTGRLTAEGIEPVRFSDRTRSEEAAHFERDKGKIVFSANRPEVTLLPGAQDRLTVLLQLGALVAGDPRRYTAGTSISLQTASTRDADLWKFTVEGTEELQLPGGRLQTLRLQRAPRFEFDQKVELWLAPGQDYLPVRLRLTQPNGDSVDQEWISTERG